VSKQRSAPTAAVSKTPTAEISGLPAACTTAVPSTHLALLLAQQLPPRHTHMQLLLSTHTPHMHTPLGSVSCWLSSCIHSTQAHLHMVHDCLKVLQVAPW
jgi:hypothetical protein